MAHNETPHLLSRGGYKKLEQKLVKQKIKEHFVSIEEGNNVDSLNPPSHHPHTRNGRVPI